MHRNIKIEKARRSAATCHAKFKRPWIVGGMRVYDDNSRSQQQQHLWIHHAQRQFTLQLHRSTINVLWWHYKSARRAGSALLCTILLYLFEIARAHTTYSISMCIVLTQRGRLRRSFRFLSQFFDFDCFFFLHFLFVSSRFTIYVQPNRNETTSMNDIIEFSMKMVLVSFSLGFCFCFFSSLRSFFTVFPSYYYFIHRNVAGWSLLWQSVVVLCTAPRKCNANAVCA